MGLKVGPSALASRAGQVAWVAWASCRPVTWDWGRPELGERCRVPAQGLGGPDVSVSSGGEPAALAASVL